MVKLNLNYYPICASSLILVDYRPLLHQNRKRFAEEELLDVATNQGWHTDNSMPLILCDLGGEGSFQHKAWHSEGLLLHKGQAGIAVCRK